MQVLSHTDIFPVVIRNGARKKKVAFVHRTLIAEAVNTTISGIAQEAHDEVLEYILQVPYHWTASAD